MKIIKFNILTGLFLTIFACSCSSPSTLKKELKVELLSFSQEEREIEIISNESLDMSHYVLRQGESKSLYSLAGIYLEKEVAQKITLPKNFLRKKNNSLSLSRLEVVSILEDS